MSRRNPKRSSKGGRFARLPLTVLNQAAVKTLGHADFRILVLFAAQFTGYNNGSLGLTASQAAESGIRSDKTFYRALRELEARGLIERTFHASRVPPRPTMYALTWIAIDDTSYSRATRLPSHAYREWKAPGRKPRRRKVRLRAVT